MLLIYFIIAIVVLAAAAMTLIRTRKKRLHATVDMDMQTVQKVKHLDYQPGIKSILPVSQRSIPHPVRKPDVLPRPVNVSVTENMPDISSSLRTLTEKYSLDQFTLATRDGLVFASGGGDNAADDAARFGEIFVNDPLAETPGVTLFGLDHKGSVLIGIIRTNLYIPDDTAEMIESDTKDILNTWI